MNDYYQRPNFSYHPVTRNLLIANFALYGLTFFIRKTQGFDLDTVLGLHYFQSSNFKPHQLISFLFMHDPTNVLHIIFNMYGLWMFGRILESHWGPKRFFTYYMICGIGSGISQQLAWYYTFHHNAELLAQSPALVQYAMDNTLAIGASGAIFGLLLAFGIIFPNVPLYIMFIPVPIKAKWLVIGYGLYELFQGVENSAGDNVAHYAHIGGLVFGFVLLLIWKKGRIFH